MVTLAVLFFIEATGLGWAPRSRADWALENALVVVFVVALFWLRSHIVLSRTAYTLLFLFLSLHEIGAHYTYSYVPYDAWVEAWTGRSLGELTGWQRNHFDRFLHLAYGLLLTIPVREALVATLRLRGAWRSILPVAVTMAGSTVYELVEWAAAMLFGGDLGIAYVGAQGDVWDAQKDMALATFGALVAGTVATLVANNGGRGTGHRTTDGRCECCGRPQRGPA